MSIESQSPGPGTPGGVHVGAAVISRDGKNFAHVKSVRGGYFELDVPRARDFWLSSSYAETFADGYVTLSLSRDEVDDHRLNAPGLEAPESASGAPEDAVIGNQEALAQRERMERELEAQRARMGRPPEDVLSTGVPDPGAASEGDSGQGLDEALAARDVDTRRGEMQRKRDETIGLRIDQ